MSKKSIKNIVEKAKEINDNLTVEEKEALKKAGKETWEQILDVIETKKKTGKFNRAEILSAVAAILSLFALGNTSIQPDIVDTVDEAKTEVLKVVSFNDSVNTANTLKLDTSKVNKEDLSAMIRIVDGNIVIGEVE